MKQLMITMMCAGALLTGCKEKKAPALDPANLNTAVAAGDDFYEYATGGWQKSHPLGAEYSRFGSFDMLREQSLDQLKTIIGQVQVQKNEPGSVADKIATLYTLGMDEVKLNDDGFSPLVEQLASIYAINDKAGFTQVVADLHHQGIDPYFAFFVGADDKNSSMNIAQLQQAGLGMGDRDYYLKNDEKTSRIREAYKVYVQKLFTLIGFSEQRVKEATDNVMNIETSIATVSWTREHLRKSLKNYNKMTLKKFTAGSHIVDWADYFKALGVAEFSEINARQADYYPALDKAMAGFTIAQQKDYLAFSLLNSASGYLSDEFTAAGFDFYGRVMSGKEEMRPRWKRVLGSVDGALSEALGQLYVERYFPETSKAKMLDLVENLRTALGERIRNLTWMSDATKEKALEKLATFYVKIGYPDKWRDYSGLEIKDDSYWANIVRSNIFDVDYNLSQLGKPVDRDRWQMSPQTVNAYYEPTTNEICFPAAILQPPFFNPDADDAVNYGSIGVVIGHEMSHGFDDEGRNFDRDGNMIDWWTVADAAKFETLAAILVKQYDAIVIADGVHANGALTLGENIADHGGLLISYQAWQSTLKGEQPAPIDGFTGAQRFFLSYATVWAQNIRPEEELFLTTMDVHSLGKWRVNAGVRNIDAFYDAFNITPADPMYLAPEQRVVIW